MRRTRIIPLALLTLTSVGCTQSQGGASSQPAASQPATPQAGESTRGLSASDRDAVDEDGKVRRGFALSEAPVLTVVQAHEQADALRGKSVKIKGEVSSVCTKAGCWFMLREADKQVRITSKGYKYFVPRNSVGQTAIVEGKLSAKMLDQKTAQHYEDDKAHSTGEPAKQVTGPVYEVAVASVGLEMSKP